LFLVGSYPSSGRNIEPELLRIIQQNCRLDELIITNQSDELNEVLRLVKPRPTAGSLAMYDGFDSSELHQFRQNFRIESDITITGSENFPGEMLTPRNDRVSLPDDIYELLVYYYNDAYYDLEFVTIAGASDKLILEEESEDFIIVLPNITQHGRIRFGSEIFGTNIAPQYQKNSYILAKFIQDNEMIDTFQVKFNFTLHIQLIFQLVRKRINWLLSNGTNLRQTLKPGFTAKPMMMMMMDAMLSFGRTSITKLIEIVLFLFITFIADLYLVNL